MSSETPTPAPVVIATEATEPDKVSEAEPSEPIVETLVEQFSKLLPEIVTKVSYNELWGYPLIKPADFEDTKTTRRFKYSDKVTEVILNKYLKANKNDLIKAKEQLTKTLEWRRDFNPIGCIDEVHDDIFKSFGFLSTFDSNGKERAVTWNIYGAAEDPKTLFEDKEKFLRWRVGLMEKGLMLLDLDSDDNDTSYMVQIHDYKNISMLRVDPVIKSATKDVINIFSSYYPEVLSAKYFVNVNYFMSLLFSFTKLFLSAETINKFHVLYDGKTLVNDLGDWVPFIYGGKTTALNLDEGNEVAEEKVQKLFKELETVVVEPKEVDIDDKKEDKKEEGESKVKEDDKVSTAPKEESEPKVESKEESQDEPLKEEPKGENEEKK